MFHFLLCIHKLDYKSVSWIRPTAKIQQLIKLYISFIFKSFRIADMSVSAKISVTAVYHEDRHRSNED